jgi:protein-tyrosine phosphatase
MFFSDIHTHVLYNTDDGAKKREDMYKMIDAAYKSGTRLLFATPHFAPSFFGDNREMADHAFRVLKEYCDEKYTDLEVIFGNELYYRHDCISWLKGGLCRTMGETGYLLVEFNVKDSEDRIAEGIYRLQNLGYIPILAHAERYKNLSVGRIWSFRENGVLVQINTESIVSPKDFGQKKRVKALIEKGYVDFISTDTHDLKRRPPEMDKSYEIFAEKYGRRYADDLFRNNALRIFGRKTSEEETK